MVENATFSMGGRDTYDPILASEFSFSISAPNNNIITRANKIGKSVSSFQMQKSGRECTYVWLWKFLLLALTIV